MVAPDYIVPFGTHETIDTEQLDGTDPIRTADEVVATRDRYTAAFCQEQLDAIYSHLWSAGSKGNISPLHHQKVLCRTIILTERPDLHLVWFSRIIYIQPLPNTLLNEHFFTTVVLPSPSLYSTVVGFLYSYTKLIAHESDLTLAHELHLVNKAVTWKAWVDFRTAIVRSLGSGAVKPVQIHRRYDYGELRLARLNYIYRLTFRGVTYFTTHREYATYFTEYLTTGITVFAFVTVALTAMQVIVGIEGISQALVETMYRFSIAVLIVVAGFSAAVGVLFGVLFVFNTGLAIAEAFPVRRGGENGNQRGLHVPR
ncbi:hypothetical protein BP5796_02845 [Coleophoma crateriformis]|uniref:Uncharacterized protein n=1 Tax=Coleophoma crateriformis TaxID=565419 RepID=A0A3D8SZG9_9HELO|nr:hypothetical protein BP5796_02845 [Coleophoma crateriformis]